MAIAAIKAILATARKKEWIGRLNGQDMFKNIFILALQNPAFLNVAQASIAIAWVLDRHWPRRGK